VVRITVPALRVAMEKPAVETAALAVIDHLGEPTLTVGP
jgi:hypothetical protein